MRHRLPAALALALLSLGISGCSDDEKPDVADPTTSSPTSSEPTSDPPSSSATPEPKPESPTAFLRRWQKASDTMQATGNTEAYLALGPDCKPCGETAATVERYYGAGGFIRFDGTKVRRISKVGVADDVAEFDLVRTTPPTEYQEKAGGPVKSFPGGDSTFRVRMRRVDGEWTVLYFSQLAS